MLHYKYVLKLGMVAQAYNPFLQEAGAGGLPQVQGQSGLHNATGYKTSVSKKKNKIKGKYLLTI